MVLLQTKDPLAVFIMRREFLPFPGFFTNVRHCEGLSSAQPKDLLGEFIMRKQFLRFPSFYPNVNTIQAVESDVKTLLLTLEHCIVICSYQLKYQNK